MIADREGLADHDDGPAPTGYVAIVLWSFTRGEFAKLEFA